MYLMSRRAVVVTAAGIALVVSGTVLALLYAGVAGVLRLGNGLDLRYVLWPASYMLVIGWHTTAVGVAITIASVTINCAMYVATALGLRSAVLSFRRP